MILIYLILGIVEANSKFHELVERNWTEFKDVLQSCYPITGESCKICPYDIEGSTQDPWGECFGGNLCSDIAVDKDLQDFVGRKTAAELGSSCKCSQGQFGPHCKSKQQDTDLGLCGKGTYNVKNYLSACDCRDINGNIVPYHGWYCEVHNIELCSPDYPFYDESQMTKVGHNTPNSICKKCDDFINNCAECKQDAQTLWKVTCLTCKEDFQTTENDCMDECDMGTNFGCKEEIEECKMKAISDTQGNHIEHTFCKCLIEGLEESDVCEYKINCGEDQNCNSQGKCVQLPGVVGKSCLCNINYAGEYCESSRTCSNGFNKYQKFCLNGGKCHTSLDESENICECSNEFHGPKCEMIHPCHHLKNSCKKQEKCIKWIGSEFDCLPEDIF